MLIGFDASRAIKIYRRGPEQYSFQLLKALAKIDQENQYLLYSPLLPKDELANLPSNFSWKIMPFPRLWTQIRLSFEMLKNPPDILFVPSHIIPIIHPKKVVLTIHDLGFKYFPEVYPPFARFYENFSLRFLVKSASKIIAVSEATKKDLLKFASLEPNKVVVIHHGFDQKLYCPSKQKSFYPFIFFLGSLEEKKNIIGLIKAFSILKRDFKIKHKLVLAGRPGYGYKRIKKEILNLPKNISQDIKELGYLSDQEAASWMKKADLYILPSFFEGFGIPAIEAMASGVPVIASDILALSEIAGGAALLVDPENPEEISQGIKKVIFDDKFKKDLIKKGLERAKDFSWQKCAKETLRVLEEVGKR